MNELTAHLAGKTHVIWDWNGTLVDDVDLAAQLVSEIVAAYGLGPISRAEYVAAFKFPVAAYYRDLGCDLSQLDFHALNDRFAEGYRANAHKAKLHRGASELLAELRGRGVCHAVLSASKQDDLELALAHFGVAHHFTHVYGLPDRLAASKVARGHELLRALDVAREAVVLVGDTDHDADVGEALGVDVILLSGGHQCETRLAKRHSRVVRRLA